MRREVLEGLSRASKELSPKYFYDERGSRLFEEITRLPEYYLARAERALLERWMRPWVAELRPRSLVELGAGSARKTRVVLDAMRAEGCGEVFVPMDVSAEFLLETAKSVRAEYPGLRVEPEVMDMTAAESVTLEIPTPTLYALLGSTLGNFYPPEAVELLGRVRSWMKPGDALLLGVDLRPGSGKSVDVVEAAYNDAQGVTARFNLNVLRVLNRELGADFDLEGFEHRARYDPAEGRIEISLRALEDQTVHFPGSVIVSLEKGEEIRTEVSCKYDRASLAALAEPAGLRIHRWAQDEEDRFALVEVRLDIGPGV